MLFVWFAIDFGVDGKYVYVWICVCWFAVLLMLGLFYIWYLLIVFFDWLQWIFIYCCTIDLITWLLFVTLFVVLLFLFMFCSSLLDSFPVLFRCNWLFWFIVFSFVELRDLYVLRALCCVCLLVLFRCFVLFCCLISFGVTVFVVFLIGLWVIMLWLLVVYLFFAVGFVYGLVYSCGFYFAL